MRTLTSRFVFWPIVGRFGVLTLQAALDFNCFQVDLSGKIIAMHLFCVQKVLKLFVTDGLLLLKTLTIYKR